MKNVRSTYTDSVNFYAKEDPRELIERFGSPLYVYNENILRQSCKDLLGLSSYLGFKVNYSAKANANPELLKIIREEGCVADAMSPGELQINLRAGFTPEEILYVCNNVSEEELKFALSKDVLVSVDSLAQAELLASLNPGGKIMVRFNPGIGAGHSTKVVTGGKETKFGVDPDKLPELLAILKKYDVRLVGINQHIGSLFMDGQSYLDATEVLLDIASQLPDLEIIDFGGGFGIPYKKYESEPRLDLKLLGKLLHEKMTTWATKHNYKGLFYIEPGRYIVAESGLVLGSVHATKSNGENLYVGTDIGFNVLARPMLYDAFHDIEIYRDKVQDRQPETNEIPQTLVGNICESGDILAKKRILPKVEQGDIIAMLDAGAYGFVMASTYNHRLRPAEVLIQSNGTARLIRRRETFEDLCVTLNV